MKKLLLLTFLLTVFLCITAFKIKHRKAGPVYLVSMETHAINGYPPDTTFYNYDDSNRLAEIIRFDLHPRKIQTDKKLYYDTQNRLIAVDEDFGTNQLGFSQHNKFTFTYAKNYVVEHRAEHGEKDNKTSDRVFIDTLILNNNGLVIKHIYGFDINHVYSFKVTAMFNKLRIYDVLKYDAMGNLVWRGEYGVADTVHAKFTETYVYDDSKSPFLNVKGNYQLCLPLPNTANNYVKVHNIYRDVRYSTNGQKGIGTDMSSTCTYQLNDAGYPVVVHRQAVNTDLKPYKVGKPYVTTTTYSYVVR